MMTSSGSTTADASLRLKLSVSQLSDELASEVLSMLYPEVQNATSIFYKSWIDCWQSFVETSDAGDISTTMESQIRIVFLCCHRGEDLL